ncbi:MAG: hypothetical protein M3O70_08770 [Actinomycetota bacterium]|nr:hypothetical protein [Actinomycetota bacterium]
MTHDDTPEMLTELAVGLTQMHELFGELRRSGFTEEQALRIIAYGLFHQPPERFS